MGELLAMLDSLRKGDIESFLASNDYYTLWN